MNVILTCGGTAGHINPAIAVANMMKQRHPDCNILFIGASGHMEEKLVPQAGYELKVLPVSGLSRQKSLAAVKKNINAVKCVLSAVGRCKKIIREFKPDVIIGTGGYASFPALYAGHQLGIPTCVHEANALPGLTTKLAANIADRVMVCFDESRQYYKNPDKVSVVGMPIRQEFLTMTQQEAKERLGLSGRPLVVSAFGSQGAKVMNQTMAEMFTMEKNDGFPFHHIHAVGSFGWGWMPELVHNNGVDLEHSPEIDMREYIYDMPEVMVAADVFISRAGSATCNEIAASGTPCILIPSPNVTNNHQEKNARVLEKSGGAVVVLESECTAERIYSEVNAMLGDGKRRAGMEAALKGLVKTDATERICDILEELAKA
ncbi:MAG: undecaprenyldiphospho-muramoylpentapeptide beta-N-acetylglucosaminyltransferase [Oscillospiraceae bacterium]|nr:undecaprenyldiphospho-muramoylpentapeptide beta-N-acetylglucosaminyltransferase [Oscillospiraceae bacterium]